MRKLRSSLFWLREVAMPSVPALGLVRYHCQQRASPMYLTSHGAHDVPDTNRGGQPQLVQSPSLAALVG